MNMNWRIALTALVAAAGATLADAQGIHTLYATSLRSQALAEASGISGNLYTINLGSGTATLVGALRLPGGKPIGVTGMAVHPTTGVFYGITSDQSPSNPRTLVSIDPVTGSTTLIGELGHAVSDISFDAKGNLYAYVPATSQLGTVNTSTGNVRLIGRPGPASTTAGLAIDVSGTAWVTRQGAGGTLDKLDLDTGVITPGPPLNGAPFPAAINSMSFSPSGLLLAVNSNAGSPASARLVTINTSTGVITSIGPLPDDTDALSFTNAGGIANTLSNMSPGARVVIGVVSTLLVVLASALVLKSRR